ncbi:MAG: hypothetical protein DRN15_04415 [Thermoprotei archaeon]|nr:MAG: hypothetical protein DRN15_04415 [Thermoprotei archaeon]
MTRFCIICGRVTDVLIENMCLDCFRKNRQLIQIPSEIEVEICPECYSFRFRGKWLRVEASVPQIMLSAVRRIIEARARIDTAVKYKLDLRYEGRAWSGRGRTKVKVIVTGTPRDDVEPYQEVHIVSVKPSWKLCPSCLRIKGKHEEAIVQIRAEERKLTSSERRYIMELVEKIIYRVSRDDPMAIVIDYEEREDGIDLHMASKRIARIVASYLQREYLASIKESYKVVGMKKGEVITRETISVRLPKYKAGDVIRYKGKPLMIMAIEGGRVYCVDLERYEEVTLKSKDLRDVQVSGCERVEAMVIAVTGSVVHVMRLDNYQTLELELRRVPIWMKEGRHVALLIVDGRPYIAPIKSKTIKES